jgi:hypothetical protein
MEVDKKLMAVVAMYNKNVRVISFTRNQVFTINFGSKKPLSVENMIEYANTPLHEDFDDVVSNVRKFSEIEYEAIQKEHHDPKTDVLVIHDHQNTQIINAKTGVVLWKRLT